MRIIDAEKSNIDYTQYVKRGARESDYSTLITGDCLVRVDGKPRILYKKIESLDTRYVRQAVKNIKYATSTRTGGLKTTSRIFGYSPRNTIRQNFCSATSLAVEQPTEHSIICDFGSELAEFYVEYFPEVYQKHKKEVDEKIKSDWVIQGSPFTSGIVNKNNPLKYHFDAGNMKNVLSNMVVFKRNTSGGYLSCPEFDIGFEVADNTVILFDGQNILHGVTPITKHSKDSYRYSIVYYTLKQIWRCEPLEMELALIRQDRENRETKRANGERDADLVKQSRKSEA